MKERFVDFFQDYGVAIQTITSFILLVVTITYVVATFKMIHTSQKTFLRPTKIDRSKDTNISVKNYGPGTAINIKFFMESHSIKKELTDNYNYTAAYILEIFKEHYIELESDNFEIEPNKTIIFKLTDENIKIGNKVLLYWESISGEKLIFEYHLVIPSVGAIKILGYKKIKIKSIRNAILNPIQFTSKFLERALPLAPYDEQLKHEKMKVEKENTKWLI
ncbi:hypothetical protein BK120_32455 [Paenibacillus sp. FSL A5-0031]|uniref:hypothetical protein n=1 Tax=Paenibacillus sp. FSL A5-0031 TaxID=1920420 RepID=UPI00096EB31F|nr:hypothetical protein [Paenibacillus sp. FSL A5-0031]OME73991.1 hypothetical protein BK120_32455 [Paenibacillus sp. FSL A5-0031]